MLWHTTQSRRHFVPTGAVAAPALSLGYANAEPKQAHLDRRST
jgi:hypothetical protein